MKSLKKRIITTALAGTMALSLAVPAFASGNTTKVTATYSEIAIDVVVPGTAAVTINPMGMPIKLPVTDADNDTPKEVGSTIAMTPSAIINKSSMDLAVGATVTGTVKGNFKFAPTAWDPAGDAALTTNSAFVFLEMKKAGADVLNDDKTATDATKLSNAWEQWADTATTDMRSASDVADKVAGVDGANDCIVVLSTKATTSSQGLVKLDAATAGTGGTLEPGNDSVGLFRLGGQVVESPKTPWAKTDGFGATIAFSFKASKPATGGAGG